MSTQFKLYNVKKEDMYTYKTKEEKEIIRERMVKMALEKGIKPTARYFNTYPQTVRKWVKKYKEKTDLNIK